MSHLELPTETRGWVVDLDALDGGTAEFRHSSGQASLAISRAVWTDMGRPGSLNLYVGEEGRWVDDREPEDSGSEAS